MVSEGVGGFVFPSYWLLEMKGGLILWGSLEPGFSTEWSLIGAGLGFGMRINVLSLEAWVASHCGRPAYHLQGLGFWSLEKLAVNSTFQLLGF